jgi:hypothetical protein
MRFADNFPPSRILGISAVCPKSIVKKTIFYAFLQDTYQVVEVGPVIAIKLIIMASEEKI